MSYLSKILGAGAAQKLPEEFEGIKIVERPIEDFGKREKGGGKGMHRLDEENELTPDSHEFHNLIEDALKDGFQTIFVYNQGSKHKKPHLYLIKSSTVQGAASRMEILSALSDLQEMLDRKQISQAISAVDKIKEMI